MTTVENKRVAAKLLPFFFACLTALLVSGCGQDSNAAKESRSGEVVFNDFCFACHLSGAAGAPKLGDQQAWQPYLDKGAEEVFKLTKAGYGRMPKMGTCFDCSDEELRTAIAYLSGATGKAAR